MYKISYHVAVPDDIASIGEVHRRRIKEAIEQKLESSPVRFGKPLQNSLSGLRSLRVGDYRVVFQITGLVVFVVLIAHRSMVYKIARKSSKI